MCHSSVRVAALPAHVEDEFSAFVSASSRRLLHVATLITGDRDRAEEAVQAVLVNAYPRWAAIKKEDPFAYVRRGIVNHHVSWWQRVGRRESLTNRVPEPALPDHANVVNHRLVLLEALQALTRRERQVIVLRYIEDLSEHQTAAELGVAIGTVKSTTARALAKLRACDPLAAYATEFTND